MKKLLLLILISVSVNISFAQNWMTDLDVAERLALVQNKLLVVVWENSYYNGAPVYINDGKGTKVLVNDMFKEPVIDSLLWAHFIPVVLSESEYPERFETIKSKRSKKYIEKFNDGSLKVMDANGNILNLSERKYLLNLSEFIYKYSMDMSFVNPKIASYKRENSFYSAFYVAAQYMDFAFFSKYNVRSELVHLASIYLDEASRFLKNESFDNKPMLEQRVDLLDIQKELILQNPKKVLRRLNKIEESEVAKVNTNLRSFLYYSAYKMLGDEQSAAVWESKVSTIDMKKITSLINNTPNEV